MVDGGASDRTTSNQEDKKCWHIYSRYHPCWRISLVTKNTAGVSRSHGDRVEWVKLNDTPPGDEREIQRVR